MDISKEEYSNNLLFYTILKNTIKSKLSENKMLLLEQYIKENRDLSAASLVEFLLKNVVKENTKAYDDYATLINMCNDENHSAWCDLMVLALELLLSKNLILEESKQYAKQQYMEELINNSDQLSFNYDMVNLEFPYGQRVISALLVYMLTNVERDSEFLLEASKKTIKSLSKIIKEATEKYKINANNIFMIIMDESINQSIISMAGSSYESRVESVLRKISSNVRSRSHDKLINSVEYDYTFEIDGKLYGVSAKRTLRERYKQNFEDVDQLSVDAMFLITLGIDLNEEKLANILQRHGYFVVVAQEIYDSQPYLKKSKRVISSKNFNAITLKKLFEQFI